MHNIDVLLPKGTLESFRHAASRELKEIATHYTEVGHEEVADSLMIIHNHTLEK